MEQIPLPKHYEGVVLENATHKMISRTKKNYQEALEKCATEQWASVGIANMLHDGMARLVHNNLPETLEAVIFVLRQYICRCTI